MNLLKKTSLLLLAASTMASCTAEAAEGKLKLRKHTFEATDGTKVETEMGELPVRENRSRQDSRLIKLKFVRFKSTAENPGAPIVYLAGGPGGSGIGAARGSRFPLFMALREFGDVIALDQRGTGLTGFEELDCDDRYQMPMDRPFDRDAGARAVADKTQGCLDRLRRSGVDVDAYNTVENAADVDDLRKALGAEKITLWGISYGTHLGLSILRHHGAHVERAILAGLEGPDDTYKLPADQQSLLEEITRLAAADPAVRRSVPDLMEALRALMTRLEKQPVTVKVTDPSSGTEVPVVIGKSDLQIGIARLLRGPESFAVMPDVVARTRDGDWLPLAMSALQARSGEGIHGMVAAMDCASGITDARKRRIREQAPETLLGDAINVPFPDLCARLDIPDLGDAFRAPVVSDVPVLLISGTLDGRTPVSNGERVLEGLKNGHHLILEGAGHSDPLFLSSPDILAAMKDFLRGRALAVSRISLPPVHFVTPRKLAKLDGSALERLVGTYRIQGDDVRQVQRAGNVLFTRRGNGPPLPIRPTSATEFFYEASLTHLRFELDEKGKVSRMVVFHDGSDEGEPAEKVR